jgi:hypothetical protein
MGTAAQDMQLPLKGSTLRVVKGWQIAVVVALLVAALAIGILALVTGGTTTTAKAEKPQAVPTQLAPAGGGLHHDDLHGTPQCPQCR